MDTTIHLFLKVCQPWQVRHGLLSTPFLCLSVLSNRRVDASFCFDLAVLPRSDISDIMMM